jgi:hypothetical protein
MKMAERCTVKRICDGLYGPILNLQKTVLNFPMKVFENRNKFSKENNGKDLPIVAN